MTEPLKAASRYKLKLLRVQLIEVYLKKIFFVGFHAVGNTRQWWGATYICNNTHEMHYTQSALWHLRSCMYTAVADIIGICVRRVCAYAFLCHSFLVALYVRCVVYRMFCV